MVAATAISLLPTLAEADPSPTMVRIGALVPPVLISPEEGMRQGLNELGYIKGKNLIIERRLAETNEALQSGAADLVRSRVDVIVAFGTAAATLRCPRRRRSLWSSYRAIRSALVWRQA